MNVEQRKLYVFVFIIAVCFVHVVPISFAGLTFWDIDNSWGFYSNSSVYSGGIYLDSDMTATQLEISDDYVKFTNPIINSTAYVGTIGFQAPISTTLNISQLDINSVQYTLNGSSGLQYSRVYIPERSIPTSITGASDWNFSAGILTIETTHASPVTVVISWTSVYTITLSTVYDEIEAGFYGLLTATVVDDTGVSPGDNATFTIDGAAFEWNTWLSTYYAEDKRTTPQTVTYDTVDSFLDTENPTGTATINQTAAISWTTPLRTLVQSQVQTGDWLGAIITINTEPLGAMLYYTLILSGLSLAIYSYTGPEATLLAWMLGWGIWSSVVQGYAVTLGLIMLSLGGGLLVAKMFQDRRSSV